MQLIITIQVDQEKLGLLEKHHLCNTIRRTAHAIETNDELVLEDGGAVLDHDRKVIGTWSLIA